MVRIGTAGWNIPRALKEQFPSEGSQLQRYAARLNAAEINTSFYRPHTPETYARWASSVPSGFRFSVKMPKAISHDRGLTRSRDLLDRFLAEVTGLGARLGVLLLQLPPSHAFDGRRVGRFFELLRARHDGAVVCEPRHHTWTSDAAARLFVTYRIARVAADPPRAPGLDTPGGWPGAVYYRWHGSPRPYFSCYTADQLDALALRLTASERPGESAAQRTGEGARTSAASDNTWLVFDNTGSGSAAANALDLRSRI